MYDIDIDMEDPIVVRHRHVRDGRGPYRCMT